MIRDKNVLLIASWILLLSGTVESWNDVNNQNYMVCKPISELFTPNPTSNCSDNVSRGKVGKMGPRGERGPRGPKGDSPFAVHFNISSFAEMETRIRQLEETHEAQKTKINSMERIVDLLMERASSNCPFPNNGFNYTTTASTQSWEESRTLCQGIGGDLAVHGMKNHTLRRAIRAHLNVLNVATWVGMNDLTTDGVWRWLDGSLVDNGDDTWWPTEPNGGSRENCGHVTHNSEVDNLFNDNSCTRELRAICETKVVWHCVGRG